MSNEKQPLLVSADGQALPASEYASLPEYVCGDAVARARQRRARTARRVHWAAAALLLVGAGYAWTRGVGVPSLVSKVPVPGLPWTPAVPSTPAAPSTPAGAPSTPAGSLTALDGPVALPGKQCGGGSGSVHYPTSTLPLVLDAEHGLTIVQNSTHHENVVGGDDDGDNDNDAPIDPHWRRVHVSGDVVVRRAGAGRAAAVEVEAVSNDERIRAEVAVDAAAQRVQVLVDDRVWIETPDSAVVVSGDACLAVRVTVWVPAGAALRALEVDAVHLGVQVVDDVDLVAAEHVRLASVVGSLDGARPLQAKRRGAAQPAGYRFEAPGVELATTAGAVRGPWALRDRLRVATVSGPIAVGVVPVASSAEGWSAGARRGVADLSLTSVSGDISFEEITSGAHPHVLTVTSHAGNIRGAASFAEAARVHSESGDVAVTLQPVAGPEADRLQPSVAAIDTSTVSGAADVRVLDSAADVALASRHSAVSGDVVLRYPRAWAGTIRLKTVAGAAPEIRGDGVRVLPDRQPWWTPHFGHRVAAVKEPAVPDGRRPSNITATAVSGSVRLSFE